MEQRRTLKYSYAPWRELSEQRPKADGRYLAFVPQTDDNPMPSAIMISQYLRDSDMWLYDNDISPIPRPVSHWAPAPLPPLASDNLMVWYAEHYAPIDWAFMMLTQSQREITCMEKASELVHQVINQALHRLLTNINRAASREKVETALEDCNLIMTTQEVDNLLAAFAENGLALYETKEE